MANGWHRANRNSAASKARKAKYDSAEHRAARKQYKLWVEYGIARCWRCRLPITPGMAWHVGHDDVLTNVIRGPEHKRCNLGAAASKGARVANAKRQVKRAASTRLTW